MHKTLVVLLTDASNAPLMNMLWPDYERAGMDIFVVTRRGQGTVLPQDATIVGLTPIGSAGHVPKGRLHERLLDTFSMLYSKPSLTHYSHFLLIEPDCIFPRDISEMEPLTGMVTNFAGGKTDGFKADTFYHPPYWIARGFLPTLIRHGCDMVLEGDIEHGWPDRFLGWLIQKYELKHYITPANTFTENATDTPAKVMAAREAIQRHAWMIHGVKTKEQRDAILAP